MKAPDWNEVENRLYEESVSAVKSFAIEHAGEEVCYFAFDSEPYYGYVLICFDTTENSIAQAKLSAQWSLESISEFIHEDCDWQMAKVSMISASELPFANNTVISSMSVMLRSILKAGRSSQIAKITRQMS